MKPLMKLLYIYIYSYDQSEYINQSISVIQFDNNRRDQLGQANGIRLSLYNFIFIDH